MIAHVNTDLAIGLLFVGIGIGLLFGLVLHDAFKAWDDWRQDDNPFIDDRRKPW